MSTARWFKVSLAFGLAVCAAPSLAAPTITAGSFEDPAIAYGTYVYQPTNYPGATFNGHSGVAANGSPFSSDVAPNGVQYSFIQSVVGEQGVVTLDVAGLTIGSAYKFLFSAAQRSGYASNPLSVAFNGSALGSYDPSSTTFQSFSTPTFIAAATTGSLTFTGATTTTGDNDSALDNVRVASVLAGAVPEPAVWAMMILGFGTIGAALRGRKRPVGTVAFA